MGRIGNLAIVLLGACAAGAIGPASASAAITFDGETAKRKFAAYVAFLERDPAKYAAELSTVHRLERSDVEYRVRVGGDFPRDVDGDLTTDGERVFVSVSNGTGANGRGGEAYSRFSERACLAHELEHARQFDAGEFAFECDPVSGAWLAERPSFDIGDEMRAWLVQVRLSSGGDFWRRPGGSAVPRPSLLAAFASARTDADRIRVLRENGYDRLSRTPNCVWAPPVDGFAPGRAVRPSMLPNFFGRVPDSDVTATP
jgi:hypothetical protein